MNPETWEEQIPWFILMIMKTIFYPHSPVRPRLAETPKQLGVRTDATGSILSFNPSAIRVSGKVICLSRLRFGNQAHVFLRQMNHSATYKSRKHRA
jgi:hypothetical protein